MCGNRQDAAPGGLTVALVVERVGEGRCPVLRRLGPVGGLEGGGLGREDLLGEVERDAREPVVVVLPEALLHPLAELGVLAEQPLEQVRVEAKEHAVRDRLDGRGARLAEQEGALAEEVAGAEVAEVFLVALAKTDTCRGRSSITYIGPGG